MMLTALLVFDKADLTTKEEKVAALIELSQQTLNQVDTIQNLVNLDFNRVIYLGAGPFFGLAHEAQLKILELTAGQVATMYESPVGFRHGPKSLINEQTIVLLFGSVNPYTKQYDLDLIKEVAGDQIARKVVLLTDKKEALAQVEKNINELGPITEYLKANPDGKGLMERVLDGLTVNQVYNEPIHFQCRCGRDRFASVLMTLREEDKNAILEDDVTELVCHYCNEKYHFTREELQNMFTSKGPIQ